MSATLKVSVYNDRIGLFSEEAAAKISNGEYPIHFATGGAYEYKFITESEFELYTNYDATDEDLVRITELHGYAPVVYDGIDTGGVAHKVLNHGPENTETVDEETV
jgi:hypothetical protein